MYKLTRWCTYSADPAKRKEIIILEEMEMPWRRTLTQNMAMHRSSLINPELL